jgi:phage-related protein
MKTAARPLHRTTPTADSKGGNRARKPFFHTVQSKSEDLQARPRFGRPGDKYEVEADHVADRVVDGKSTGTLASGISSLGQRKEEEKPQAKAVERPGRPGELEQEVPQAKIDDQAPEEPVQAAEEEMPQAKAEEEDIQAKAEDEEPQAKAEEEDIQAKAEDEEPQAKAEEEESQAKAETEEPQAKAEKDELQAKAEREEPQAKGEKAEPQAREEEEIQARASSGAGLSASAEMARQIRASRGRGNPLPGPVRQKMEAQFGADLSGVRIHTDAPAVLLAQHLKAQAFTQGNDIFFGDGKFAPGSREGEHLLAHELTHTVQQGAVDPAQEPVDADVVRLAPSEDGDSYQVRPEIVEAMRLARGEIGKVNAKKTGGDGKRVGWERLREYFQTAFGGPVVSEQVIDRITMIEKTDKDGKKTSMDALPSWCGIFTWWAMKKAGIPIPDWKLGAPGLEALKQRPAGELPRKGDIAIDVLPNNHFAMVTGLESRKDAEGKPVKMTRIATVNGNTAGENNLGGQVQEKWHELAHWDHFLDPVGKMNLPPVPMVTVTREPTAVEQEAAAAAQPPTEAKQAPAEEGPRAEVTDLETGVEPPPPDMLGEALPEPDLSLPPPADTGPPEAVAEIEKVELTGSSDEQATKFIDASPSAMAATEPEFGQSVDTAMKGEQQDLAENPPVLEATTSGAVDAPITGPDQIPVPAGTELGDGVTGQDSGSLSTVSGPTPQPFQGNRDREKELDEEDSGSFWDAFMSFVRKFMKGVRTKDDSIDTSAGERPNVALDGEADATRMNTQREEGTTALKKQRDLQTDAFKNHPGQTNIQPRKIDEDRPAAVSEEATAQIDPLVDAGVADYAAAPLPQDVRDAADAKVSKTLTPNLAEARTQTVDAASARDTDKNREIDAAQQATAKLNAETDSAQRKLVVDNRGKVAKLQGEGISEGYDHVNAFTKDAAKEQTDQRKAIGDHVKEEEGKARGKLDDGEKDADDKKAEGEREAEEKKKKLEEEQEGDSWWDHAKGWIKKAVKAVTEAIDKVFTAVRSAVKDIIEKAKNAAIGLINAARDWVVNKLNDFRDWAKSKVDKYLGDTFPGLAKRINDGIDSVTDTAIEGVNYVADKAIEGVTALADGLAKALDKILSTFQTALKTAVRVVGAVMQGDFAEALRAAIEGACEIAGIDPKPVFEFLDRAGKAITTILKDPVKFIKNLFGAVGDGIGNFFKNIKKHLIQGVIGWLTGALSEVNLTGPFEFSPKGILSIVLQILGLTYENIKARVIKKVPAAAKVFDVVEKGYALLKRILTEGPSALWEEIKNQLSNLKETVMGAIRNWLITTVIKEGIIWLLSLTNPASAIVKAVKLVFDLVMFLVERYEQIKDFIVSVYEAVAAVAAGNFTKVTVAVENALSRVVPVLISLLASLIGLGGIAKQVKKVIETITKPINKAIDWVVDKIVAFAKKILGKVKAGAKKAKQKAKEAVEKIKDFIWPKKKFTAGGESHTLYFQKSGGRMVPYIRSTPQALEDFVAAWEASAGKAAVTKRQPLLTEARTTIGEMKTLSTEIGKLEKDKKAVPDAKHQQMLALQTKLSGTLGKLLAHDDSLAAAVERYKLEGLTATFATIPKPTGDYLTGDHQPQAAAIKLLAQKAYFKDKKDKTIGEKIRYRAAGKHAENANVINLQDARHKAGRTWGSKGKSTRATFETAVTAMEGTTTDPAARRTKAIGLLKTELTEDVSSMRTVYKRKYDDTVWSDLDAFTSGKKADKDEQKKELVGQIRGQVTKGLNIIGAQPMNELAK